MFYSYSNKDLFGSIILNNKSVSISVYREMYNIDQNVCENERIVTTIDIRQPLLNVNSICK